MFIYTSYLTSVKHFLIFFTAHINHSNQTQATTSHATSERNCKYPVYWGISLKNWANETLQQSHNITLT